MSPRRLPLEYDRTAIHRDRPSLPAERLLEPLLLSVIELDAQIPTILDFGCGRGADLAWLRRLGWQAEGYDPSFDRPMPAGLFGVVFCSYVLNVIPREERPGVVAEVAGKLERGGLALVVVRAPRSVREAAARGGWPRDADGGWWSTPTTYQAAIDERELGQLARAAGLRPADPRPGLGAVSGAAWGLFER